LQAVVLRDRISGSGSEFECRRNRFRIQFRYAITDAFPKVITVPLIRTLITICTSSSCAVGSRSRSDSTEKPVINLSSDSKQKNGASSAAGVSPAGSSVVAGTLRASINVFIRLSRSPPCLNNAPGGAGRSSSISNWATICSLSVTSGTNVKLPTCVLRSVSPPGWNFGSDSSQNSLSSVTGV